MIFDRKTQPIVLGALGLFFASSGNVCAQSIDESNNELIGAIKTPFVK